MKKVIGGLVAPVASCSANCTCPPGTTTSSGTTYTISATCPGGCSATDGVGASCSDGTVNNECSTYVAQCRTIPE